MTVPFEFLAKNCFRIAPIGLETSAENHLVMQAISSLSVEISSLKKNLTAPKDCQKKRKPSLTADDAVSPLPLAPSAPPQDAVDDGNYALEVTLGSIVDPVSVAPAGVAPACVAPVGVAPVDDSGGAAGGVGDAVSDNAVMNAAITDAAITVAAITDVAVSNSAITDVAVSDAIITALITGLAADILVAEPSGSYSEMVKDLANNEAPFQPVVNRNKRNPKRKHVVGSMKSEDSLLSAAPSRDYWDIHIGNIDGQKVESSDQIKSFMEKRGLKPLNVWLVNKQSSRRLQAKVRVKLEEKDSALNPHNWPIGLTIRSWSYSQKKNASNDIDPNL